MNSRNEKQIAEEITYTMVERHRRLSKGLKPFFFILSLFGVLFSVNEIFRLGLVQYHENLYYYGMIGTFLSSAFLHNFGYITSKGPPMSPTILKIGPYRLFFNSREEIRPHIHVSCPEGEAKFWLEPIVSLASYYRLSPKELRKIEEIVRGHEDEFKSAWDQHFAQ